MSPDRSDIGASIDLVEFFFRDQLPDDSVDPCMDSMLEDLVTEEYLDTAHNEHWWKSCLEKPRSGPDFVDRRCIFVPDASSEVLMILSLLEGLLPCELEAEPCFSLTRVLIVIYARKALQFASGEKMRAQNLPGWARKIAWVGVQNAAIVRGEGDHRMIDVFVLDFSI
ncbi:hypothetical protein AUP68_15531 [Ilyonectria robusta]